jgi:uncharacterized protein (TIGR02246 family)
MPGISKPAVSAENAIRELIAIFVAGWNDGDGEALAAVFAKDADFTAITGLYARGRELIARGHNEILSTIYYGTTLSGEVQSIRYLRPDVALIEAKFRLQKNGQTFFPGVTHTSAGIIATHDDGRWSIAAFRNMVPFSRPLAGPVEEKLMSART